MMQYNKSLRTILLLLGLLLSTVTFSQERREIAEFKIFGIPASPADERQLEELIREFKSSWADQDTERFIALHSSDVEWINAYARMFRGIQPLSSFLERRLFPAYDSKVSKEEVRNMRVISTRYVGDSAAVVHMYTDGNRGDSRVDGESARRTHLHLVLEKQATEWRIVHTAIMDAR